MPVSFERVAIIGCGLMGGSLGLALKQQQLATSVIGYDVDNDMLHQAAAYQAIDQAASSLAQAVEAADLVVLATPVGCFASLCQQLMAVNYLGELPIFTDLCSVKLELAQILQQPALSQLAKNFVLAHPIAGKEVVGVQHAKVDLFKHATVIVTLIAPTNRQLANRVIDLWQILAANIQYLSPQKHDEIYAAVSHMPHLLAFSYILGLCKNVADNEAAFQQLVNFAGSGFRDFSRIAGGDATMWADVLLANKHSILKHNQSFKQALLELETCIRTDDRQALQAVLQRVSAIKRQK